MRGLGTLINALAIIVGGIIGIGGKRLLKEHYQETIMKATGFSVLFLGAAGTFSKMLVLSSVGGQSLDTAGSMNMILSMVGNILIFCVGVNLIWPRTIKVANLLPALLVAILLA